MKKFLLVLAALAMVAASAFAVDLGDNFSIGANGHSRWMIYSTPDLEQDGTSWVDQGWGGAGGIRFGITATIDYGVFGAQGQLFSDNATGAWTAGDNLKAWIKPIEQLSLQLGKYNEDEFRGKAADGVAEFNGAGDTGDTAFQRFTAGGPLQGVLLRLYPISGLEFAWNLQPAVHATAMDAFAYSQIALGYTMDGIGLFRAQYVGLKGENKSYMQIAANVTAVSAFPFEIAARIPLYDQEKYADPDTATNIQLWANPNFGAFSAPLIANLKLPYMDPDLGSKLHIDFTAKPNYNLGSFSIFADLGIAMDSTTPKSGDATTEINLVAGPGVYIPVGPATFVFGLSLKVAVPNEGDATMGLDIPLKIAYWI
jgi:hypothetical protein